MWVKEGWAMWAEEQRGMGRRGECSWTELRRGHGWGLCWGGVEWHFGGGVVSRSLGFACCTRGETLALIVQKVWFQEGGWVPSKVYDISRGGISY